MTQKHKYSPNWSSGGAPNNGSYYESLKQKDREQRAADRAADEAKRRAAFDALARGESPFPEKDEQL